MHLRPLGVHQLAQKEIKHFWLGNDGEHHAVKCAPKVGVVVNVVAATLAHVHTIPQIAHAIHYGGYRRKGKPAPGGKQNEGKHHAAYATRGAKAGITVVVAIFEIAGQIADYNAADVQPPKAQWASHCTHHAFNSRTKKIQRKHVKQQMLKIGVDEAAGEQAPILAAVYRRWIEYEVVVNLLAVEGRYRYQHGKYDDDEGL